MAEKKETVLRFVLKTTGNPLEIMSRFHPNGKTVLNRSSWRGKEPRSCGVTKVKGRPYYAGSTDPLIFDVEVSYRPKGCITYVGGTKYDGWTAMLLDRAKDGTLLDGHGKPLPAGHDPVLLPYELYEDVDYDQIEFGDFVGEFPVERIKRLRSEDVMRQIMERGKFRSSTSTAFMAPRRQRPLVKIMLSNAPSFTGVDEWRTRIINVSNSTPHLSQVLLDHLTEMVSGFIEGRYSMVTLESDDFVYVKLDHAIVDCTPNEHGKESRFNCFSEYFSTETLEELATRMMATYEVEIDIVEGEKPGLVLKRSAAST